MQYKILAAYALALLRDNPDLWIPARNDAGGMPTVWFLDGKGVLRICYHRTYKRSILGAMRAAKEVLAPHHRRAYDVLYDKCLQTARTNFNSTPVTLGDLDYVQCCAVLKMVAES